MLEDCVEIFAELVLIVVDAVQIGADAGDSLSGPTGFLDLVLTQPKQCKLHRVEGDSILAVDGRGRAKGDHYLVA